MKMKMKVCFDSFDEDVASKTGNLATAGAPYKSILDCRFQRIPTGSFLLVVW